MIALHKKLSAIENLTSSEIELIIKTITKNRFRKGQILLSPGQYLRELYLIESGFARGYFTHDNIDETVWIIDGGSFIVPSGMLSKQGVSHYIEFLSDTLMYMLPVDAVRNGDTPLGLACRKLLLYAYDEYLHEQERRENINHIPNAQERYDLFKKEFPHIIGQVNNQMMASLLKMSLKHFVRLKSGDM